jgi:hypothetical protein
MILEEGAMNFVATVHPSILFAIGALFFNGALFLGLRAQERAYMQRLAVRADQLHY